MRLMYDDPFVDERPPCLRDLREAPCAVVGDDRCCRGRHLQSVAHVVCRHSTAMPSIDEPKVAWRRRRRCGERARVVDVCSQRPHRAALMECGAIGKELLDERATRLRVRQIQFIEFNERRIQTTEEEDGAVPGIEAHLISRESQTLVFQRRSV